MTTATHARFDLLRCSVGDETYGIHLPAVRAIQRSDQLRRAPGAHGRVGTVHERGAAIAVYSLASLLGRPEPRPVGLQTIVVLEAEPRPWGLLVDRAAQQLRVPVRVAVGGISISARRNAASALLRSKLPAASTNRSSTARLVLPDEGAGLSPWCSGLEIRRSSDGVPAHYCCLYAMKAKHALRRLVW